MTPEQIAALITEHPDVINEISKKQLAALGLAGLVGLGSQFGGSKIDPKKIEPIVAQEPEAPKPKKPRKKVSPEPEIDAEPSEAEPEHKAKEKPKEEAPKYIKKPEAGPLQGDVDNIFTLVSAMNRKDPEKLVSKDFKRVFDHFSSDSKGLSKKDVNQLMIQLGLNWTKRFSAMRALEAKIGFDDGFISWEKLTSIFPELS